MIGLCVQRLWLAAELRRRHAEAGLAHERLARKIDGTLAALTMDTITSRPIRTEPRRRHLRAAPHLNLLNRSPGIRQSRRARQGSHRTTRSIRGPRWITRRMAAGESPATAIALAAASRSPPPGGRWESATPSSAAPARFWSSAPPRGGRSSDRSRLGGSTSSRRLSLAGQRSHVERMLLAINCVRIHTWHVLKLRTVQRSVGPRGSGVGPGGRGIDD